VSPNVELPHSRNLARVFTRPSRPLDVNRKALIFRVAQDFQYRHAETRMGLPVSDCFN
jgi:hypothetical protein